MFYFTISEECYSLKQLNTIMCKWYSSEDVSNKKENIKKEDSVNMSILCSLFPLFLVLRKWLIMLSQAKCQNEAIPTHSCSTNSLHEKKFACSCLF